MLRKLLYLLRLALFWMLFFQAGRVVFAVYNRDKMQGIPFGEVLMSFVHAIRLDISATCYMLAIPFLVSLVSNFIKLERTVKVQAIFNHCLVAVMTIVIFSDAVLYHEWGTKLNGYALSFTKYPREVMASAAGLPYIRILILMAAFAVAAIFILHKAVHLHQYALMNNTTMHGKKESAKASGLLLLELFLVFLGIRGGLGVVPINQSAVFFSGKPVLNHTALNPGWNLMYSFFNAGGTLVKNPYNYMGTAEAQQRVHYLYDVPPQHIQLLNNPKPNVVLIMLESWTADVIEKLGGESGLTNGFNALSNEGLLFTNLYANGDRTDKGLVAIYSAYPSQTTTSIISQPEKFEKLPSLLHPFNEKGYQSAFYYGGESEFANMRAYLLHCGFQKMIDRNQFDGKDMNSKWGAHDGIVFNRLLKDLGSATQPFFYGMLTLSSHEPFEIPVEAPQKATGEADLFRNAIWYSDQCLQNFMREAQKQPWYANTLFILVADHGHRLPKNYIDLSVPGRFRIPLLLMGGALRPEWRGKAIDIIGSQTDIGKTLLTELQMPSGKLNWSKDLLNPNSHSFAFYAWNDGFGWVTQKDKFSFDNISKKVMFPYRKPAIDSLQAEIPNGQAYLQCFFDDYIAR